MVDPLPRATLERVVRAAFGGVVVVESVTALHGDASSRRYLRLALRGARPATAVVMLLGEGRFTPGSDELGGGVTVTELPFLNVGRYLAAHGFPVPQIQLDAAVDDGLLLLEDVGDVTMWQAASAPGADVDRLFGSAIDLLVSLQATGERSPDPACYAFQRRFDPGLAWKELEHFVDHGIETRHGKALAAPERRALLAALAPVTAPFTGPAELSHRDFMAWNLHVQGDRLRLIDFQDALMGPPTYDLAALLTDRSTAEVVDGACEAALLERYRSGRAAAGLAPLADLERSYHLCMLHRALKVIGRFYFLERVRNKPGYLVYLPAVYAVARRAFSALPELEAARGLASAHVPELAA